MWQKLWVFKYIVLTIHIVVIDLDLNPLISMSCTTDVSRSRSLVTLEGAEILYIFIFFWAPNLLYRMQWGAGMDGRMQV